MAKKKTKDPSDLCLDEFRMQNAGVVEVPMNTKRSTSYFYVDRSTLGTHTEFEPSTDPKEPWDGKYVEKQNHIKQNARDFMGEIRAVPASREGTEGQRNQGFRNVTGKHGASGCSNPCVPSKG